MDWVRPVCHELGNLLAGVQLSGHFLGGELSDRDRRQVARDVQLLSAQAGAWVALIRPLQLRKPPLSRVAPAEILAALRRSVDELLWKPDQLKVSKGTRQSDVRVDSDAVHHLLALLVSAALADGGATSQLRLGTRQQSRHLVLALTDTGPVLPKPTAVPAARGRELALQVGDAILRAGGGRLALVSRRVGNRIELYLPWAPRRARAARRG